MPSTVLADTGFWIALISTRDSIENKEKALAISDLIRDQNILFPWPCLYETLRTKYFKNKKEILLIESFIKLPNIKLIDDAKYRNQAIEETFLQVRENKSTSYSLVDCVIREVLRDVTFKIDFLITFNPGDFFDICQKRKITIYD